MRAVGACIHTRIDICMDMGIEMCLGKCIDMCIGMCVGMCIDMRTDTYVCMCVDMCLHMCISVCTDTCIDMYTGMHPPLALPFGSSVPAIGSLHDRAASTASLIPVLSQHYFVVVFRPALSQHYLCRRQHSVCQHYAGVNTTSSPTLRCIRVL